ncbi:MAG: cupin domain-containing protein [Pseudomonadota bacterium]|nr:cupin domain-containing protein [Pseudomonadota bacterium]
MSDSVPATSSGVRASQLRGHRTVKRVILRWRIARSALCLPFAIVALQASAQTPVALHPDDIPAVTVSDGVLLKELTGRRALANVRTDQGSVALFHLDAGRASAWSYNRVGEESFFVLKGHGQVWTGSLSQDVRPGSFILIRAGTVRSIRARPNEALEFYAITTPAWSSDDDVMTTAPAGAPK